mmetsp:Transcript_5895/g.7887  ORF Transcript_5895/g.7887 Transcript_5895/m.7887 type:complete len:146 (-) Transcript_5895:198-635(-)
MNTAEQKNVISAEEESLSNTQICAQRKVFANIYENENENIKQEWEAKRREHLSMQPKIKGLIMEELRKNKSISYKSLSGALNFWCSADTIRRWVTSREGFSLYTERVIPKVTREIRKLQNTCHIAKGHQIELRESGERVEESAEI